MRKSLFIVASAIALAGGIVTAGPSLAEHIPAEQQSPCRPNAPAGEEVVGYDDADVQRDLPTIYYNTADPQRAYVGACGGGSAGEPIRYVEIRMTPGGPYVYGSDAAGGRAFGGCMPEYYPGVRCVDAGTASGDASDLSGRVLTDPQPALSGGHGGHPDYSYSDQRFELKASQDGVTLTRHTDHYFWDYRTRSDYVRATDVETFTATRDENGVVTLGRTTSAGCELAAEDDLRDSDPPVYTESGPASCPAPVRTASALVEDLVDDVLDAVPPPPDGVPAPAACRPSPEPGEQAVPLGNDSPAIVYVNTTAVQPYAGACTGGTDGERVRFVEVRETAGGPFVYASDGSGGHVVDGRCLPVLDDVGNNNVSLCASAAVTPSRTDASVWVSYVQYGAGYDYSSDEAGVRASQNGVEAFTYHDDNYNSDRVTRFVRRSPDGRVEAGESVDYSGFTCDTGYRVNLADPASSGPYEEGDLC